MDALFVGFLTTYSHTYSGGTKTLALYYARRYITPIAAKRSDRVSGSAVTTEFLQQARLGKDKATAGGSGIEKIVGRSTAAALARTGQQARSGKGHAKSTPWG